ncbi:MAG: flippase, partial [Nanoarchaeota archaeon]|nr:flippase [Nanoarchaeota archaeon]
SNILQPAINVLFLIFLIFLGMKVNSVIFSHLLSVIVTLSLAFFFCKHKLPKIFKKEHLKKETKKFIKRMLISYSWPIMFAGIIGTIFYWADSFVIGFFENAKSVGYYNAAIPIVMLLMLVPSLFTQLFAPLITREFSKRNREIIKEISKQVVKWIFILNLPLFILMFIFPGTIINILFGKDYLIATNALRILSIGGILSSPVYIFNSLLFMIGKSRLFLANLIISSSVNIFLNVVLVPKYSITGAALATAISWILLTLILFFETKRYLDIIPLRRKMFRVLLASIIPTILALYLRANLTASLISLVSCSFLFILLYVFSMFLTGSLDKNDVMILRTIKRKIISR